MRGYLNNREKTTMTELWAKKDIPLFDESFGQEPPALEERVIEGAKNCVIVIPGGGYEWEAWDHEGDAIAKALNKNGISAFILRYRFKPYHYPVMKYDINRAVRVVRSMAGKYGYRPDRIAVLGFSAGGHLASLGITHFDRGREDGDEIDKISCRPDLGVLCYAVLNIGGKFTHEGTSVNLLGGKNDPELAKALSAENSVTKDTPPCFIWHTAGDPVVPVENSLTFASALSEKKIPFELHIFPEGPHGIGLAETEFPHSAQWFSLLVEYIRHFWGQ